MRGLRPAGELSRRRPADELHRVEPDADRESRNAHDRRIVRESNDAPSWPGLTRPSIFFAKNFLLKNDGPAGQARVTMWYRRFFDYTPTTPLTTHRICSRQDAASLI